MQSKPKRYSPSLIAAAKAFIKGEANQGQQIELGNFILHKLALVDSISYRPGDPYATAFYEGSRYVGLELRRIMLGDYDRLVEPQT